MHFTVRSEDGVVIFVSVKRQKRKSIEWKILVESSYLHYCPDPVARFAALYALVDDHTWIFICLPN